MSGDEAQTMAVALIGEQAGANIRRQWLDGQWYFCITDVIALLTDSRTPNKYWTDMQRRIHDEGFVELAAKCRRLKMTAADGKQRLTDAADTETLLRIIQSIPSPKAEPFKRWLARVGTERLEEIENPELAADRMRQLYRARDRPMPGLDTLGSGEREELEAFRKRLHRKWFNATNDAQCVSEARPAGDPCK